MVSYAGLPQYFIDLLADHAPFVRDPEYLNHDGHPQRDVDFFEMYSGVGNLWKAVCMDRVHGTCIFCFVMCTFLRKVKVSMHATARHLFVFMILHRRASSVVALMFWTFRKAWTF